MKHLRVLSDPSAFPAPPAVPVALAEVRFEEGFREEEYADGLPFRWMGATAHVAFDPAPQERWLEVWAWSAFYDLSQTLGMGEDAPRPLVRGWNRVSTRLPAGAGDIALRSNRDFPLAYHASDPRELAVMLRLVELHEDADRHGHAVRQHDNAVANTREMIEGCVELRSMPPKLGIDMTGTCNVKPPCVYCAWDEAKALEGGAVTAPFDLQTLEDYGPFFDNATDLINCSIGEPFMMKNVDELLDAFGRGGKVLELTTNGQILTDANIKRLLGRPVRLYVSFDAATAETYARLRNDTFGRLLDNVRRLVLAKGGRNRFPHVYLVFMPMKANVHEVDDFVRLAADLGVDRLVLRPLNRSEGADLKWDRSGYRFDYQQELLPFDRLIRVSGRVAELCRHHGVELRDQMDFGGDLGPQFGQLFEAGKEEARTALRAADGAPQEPVPTGAAAATLVSPPEPAPSAPPAATAPSVPALPLPSLGAERMPACAEPWASLYVLRRGTMPCCYGAKPIAPMADFKEAWNAPLLQGIRRELSHGRFHEYCFQSPACPIVQKAAASHALPGSERVRLSVARLRERWARAGYGWPGWVYRWGKRNAMRLLGIPGSPPA